ncbi:UDP-N-acetylmuramate dehydrogenase [Thermodesulfatator atlanticus]|uniref:UDP-N-acetylmuramate dehydrogenase n=1 Tax=Thermodesulfatator atlanticus TaxID=501497 RepID=UPI0003B619D2|nr:UDP-N-acetylmuramate dehydrogenase [Thermodesulfatator atlanticus]
MNIAAIFRKEGLSLREKVSLRPFTTFKVGGPADYYFEPQNFLELARGIEILKNENIPIFLRGAGSNLLVRDGGIRGAVISLDAFDSLAFEGEFVRAEAGVPIARLLATCAEKGLSGLEFLAGVPATVGGAVRMNAGAFGKEIGDFVQELNIYHHGQFYTIPRTSLKCGYRYLDLPEEAIIVAVTLRLYPVSPTEVKEKLLFFLSQRKNKQPLNMPSAGCIFKNPAAASAGALIDHAGLKGFRCGGAEISRKHANFIVNCAGARASHILALIELAKERVLSLFGIELEEEIRVVGEG